MDFSLLEQQRPKRPRRRPPPNYFARAVQVRLLIVTSLLLLVLALMFEARKPENWQWMWAGVAAPPASNQQQDSRLPWDTASNQADPPGTVRIPDRRAKQLISQSSANPLATVQARAWAESIAALSQGERRILDQILRASRTDEPLQELVRGTWPAVFAKLSSLWDRYLAAAQESVAAAREMSDQDRDHWLDILSASERKWQERWRPALRAPVDNHPWTLAERESLVELQRIVDDLSLAEVQDDTVALPAEQYAWFRFLEELQTRPLKNIEDESLGSVGFLQLSRQPTAYRGKVVTVRGTARLAYRVPAPSNIYGIQHYFVFWVKPAGGQLSPFLVYALESPPGFPAIKDKYLDGETTDLSEKVEFSGYFFKRQAYRARDGVNTAPVLLAKVARWSPTTEAAPAAPAYSVMGAAFSVLGVGALAILLARLAYAAPNRSPQLASGHSTHDVASLAERELSPPVGEALRRLAERELDEEC